MKNFNRRSNRGLAQEKGFSLIELLMAMVVGLIIVSGVFSLYSTTRKTQRVNEDQMDMVADARFAIETIAYDLRHAGMWGATNRDGVIACRSVDADCDPSDKPTAVTGDCATDWSYNITRAVFAVNNSDAGFTTCIPASEKYRAGTDVLEVRYADSNPLVSGLRAGQAYIRSNFINGKIFVGTSSPLLPAYDTGAADPVTRDYLLHAFAYYVSDYTDVSGDGIPSLRRVSLVEGPSLQNQLLVSGVVDLQVQLGIDLDGVKDSSGNVTIDSYVNPSAITVATDWTNVYAVKIWLVLRTEEAQKGIDTTKKFNIAGASKTFGGVDGFRHMMVSSIVSLRNLKQL